MTTSIVNTDRAHMQRENHERFPPQYSKPPSTSSLTAVLDQQDPVSEPARLSFPEMNTTGSIVSTQNENNSNDPNSYPDSDQQADKEQTASNPSPTNTPRTASQSTLFSLPSTEEPLPFDVDCRSASFRSMSTNSIAEAERPSDSLTPSKIGCSPKCSSFIDEDKEYPQIATPQHLDCPSYSMDPELSMESSVSTGWTSRSTKVPLRTVKLLNPPSYIVSDNAAAAGISPIGYTIPAHCQPRARQVQKVQKIQPKVYSAIGSLESVNQHSVGSFNHRLQMATTAKKVKNKKVDLDSTTSRINKRIIQKPKSKSEVNGKIVSGLSPTEHRSNTTKRISALSTSLETNAAKISDSAKVSVKGETSEVNMIQTGATDDVRKTHTLNAKTSRLLPIIKSKAAATSANKTKKKSSGKKKVTIESKPKEIRQVELFRPSSDAYTPRMGKKIIKFKPAEQRSNMKESVGNALGTIQKPNFQDALRRVAMIIQQHIVKIERRFCSGAENVDLFDSDMRDAFAEDNFVTPRYKCSMVKLPMARAGVVYGMRKIRVEHHIPTADDIYEFGHRLFNQVQLSSECSIICLIYVERIMEAAKVPVMATTWKPIFMCGLLLASKVWQDWSSWNIEFANVYPQFSLESINKLEILFLKMVKWDLYISSSLYAKYYFALRSLLEKQDFRKRYVRMVGGVGQVSASQAVQISKRSEMLKQKSLSFLSSSF